MNLLRPIASLTSALLHRRPMMAGPSPGFVPLLQAPPPSPRPSVLPAPPSPADGLRLVVAQGAERKSEPGERARQQARSARLSVRLDPVRYRRLRLAAVHRGRSGQALLVDALDAYFAGVAAFGEGGGSR